MKAIGINVLVDISNYEESIEERISIDKLFQDIVKLCGGQQESMKVALVSKAAAFTHSLARTERLSRFAQKNKKLFDMYWFVFSVPTYHSNDEVNIHQIQFKNIVPKTLVWNNGLGRFDEEDDKKSCYLFTYNTEEYVRGKGVVEGQMIPVQNEKRKIKKGVVVIDGQPIPIEDEKGDVQLKSDHTATEIDDLSIEKFSSENESVFVYSADNGVKEQELITDGSKQKFVEILVILSFCTKVFELTPEKLTLLKKYRKNGQAEYEKVDSWQLNEPKPSNTKKHLFRGLVRFLGFDDHPRYRYEPQAWYSQTSGEDVVQR